MYFRRNWTAIGIVSLISLYIVPPNFLYLQKLDCHFSSLMYIFRHNYPASLKLDCSLQCHTWMCVIKICIFAEIGLQLASCYLFLCMQFYLISYISYISTCLPSFFQIGLQLAAPYLDVYNVIQKRQL